MFSFSNIDLEDYATKIKKAMAVTAIAISSLSFQQTAAAQENKEIQNIYHVYKDEKFIGNLSIAEKEELDTYLANKLKQMQAEQPNQELEIDRDVTFIEENVFSTEEDSGMFEALKNDIQIEAKATALVIDGQEVAYIATKEAAEQLLRTFTLQFITPDELTQFENNPDNEEAPLSTSGSRIKSLALSKDVKLTESAAVPSDIMTESDALDFLNKGGRETKEYTIQQGDAIEEIAAAYGITTTELLELNPNLQTTAVLKPGQVIQVAKAKPILELTVQREILKKQSIPFERKVVETDDLNKGETKVKQTGQAGEKSTHYFTTQTNGKQVSQNIVSDEITKEAVAEVRLKGTKETPSTGNGQLSWPTVGGYVSSELGYRWGKMHKGIDIARPSDLSIKAADHGVVVSAGFNAGGYGNRVEIDHGNGMVTTYSHMSSINVQAGQKVAAGTKIGVMGATGDSTGVHLHFELFINGQLKDPLDYL